MTGRPIYLTILSLALLLLTFGEGAACFGPKLYLGTGGGPEADLLFETVALYLKEKTGTETVRVDLEGADPRSAVGEEKVDLAFASEAAEDGTLLPLAGVPRLVVGRRPLEELQFTTIVPALRKLGALFSAADFSLLLREVEGGESAAAAVRRLLSARRLI